MLQCRIWGRGTGSAGAWEALTQGAQGKKMEALTQGALTQGAQGKKI